MARSHIIRLVGCTHGLSATDVSANGWPGQLREYGAYRYRNREDTNFRVADLQIASTTIPWLSVLALPPRSAQPAVFNREAFMRLIQIAALAAVGLGCRLNAHAQLNAWPHDLPAAHSWLMCSSLNGEPMVAWVSEKKAVVAVSSLH